jgi:hypothetical protein
MTQIKENLFDLSQDQIDASKNIYSNKIIKCLVAPYHTYNQLEKIVPYTKTTFLFPEREMTVNQLKSLVSMIVNNPSMDEFRIITTNQNIITDMIDTSVRVLTEGGDIVECPIKTFLANIHSIRYDLLENKNHQLSTEEQTLGQDRVNNLIKKIQKGSISKPEFDKLIEDINKIGEPIIANKLISMARELKITI